MILQEVLCTLRDRMLDSGYVNVFYDYCELVRRDGITFPAYYNGGGEYIQVQSFDVNGAGYCRKRGKVSITPSRAMQSMTSCENEGYVEMRYPLRIVLGVPRSKVGDDGYADDALFYEVASLLQGFTATSVQSVSVQVKSYDTDSLSIWPSEVQGMDYQMLFTLCYLSIDFDLVFVVDTACIDQLCSYYG